MGDATGWSRADVGRWALPAAGGVALLFGLALLYLALAPQSVRLRYRLTLTVLVDGKPVEGSAVQQVTFRAGGGGATGALPAAIVTERAGEAASVILPGRGLLLALMLSPDARQDYDLMVPKAFGLTPGDGGTATQADYLTAIGRLSGRRTLTGDLVPFLARFRDNDEPASLERLDPKNLAASFGPGVSLVEASVAVVDDDLKHSLARRLPWIDKIGSNFTIPLPPANGVYQNQMIRDENFTAE